MDIVTNSLNQRPYSYNAIPIKDDGNNHFRRGAAFVKSIVTLALVCNIKRKRKKANKATGSGIYYFFSFIELTESYE